MEKSDEVTKVVYPTITIPGKGTYTVKYGLGASITLEDEMKMDDTALFAEIQRWMPHKNEATGEEVPGKVSKAAAFKVLAACIWDQAKLSPREIADAFGTWDCIPEIVRVVAEAFSKTQWSNRIKLQESATPSQEPKQLQ